MAAAVPASTSPREDNVLLLRAYKKIADLKEDIRRLSDELRQKESLLTSVVDVASEQSKRIFSLTTALQDTAPRSGGLPSSESVEPAAPHRPPSPMSVAAATAQRSSQVHGVRSEHGHNFDGFSSEHSPQPLFSPTTLIVGDSITRQIRFFNAATHCFPGATVPVILDKLPSLLDSLPSSIVRVIVHVGSCDTTRQHSELTKKDFNALFLKSCGKSVFISGLIPTLGRGIGRFSRILSLHTWLQSACMSQHLGFIDNFNLFWDRPSFFRNDGLHPSRHGSRMLAANIQHAIQCTPHD
uniref:SGNH hydrolase-type esterase domain-containing protein n=1 Tax=Anabas testudineus TaxID=64144 RepID=A0A7N6AHW4_ANATE